MKIAITKLIADTFHAAASKDFGRSTGVTFSDHEMQLKFIAHAVYTLFNDVGDV